MMTPDYSLTGKEGLVRSAQHDDSEAIARIYNHYVRETVVTFEEQEVSAREMAARMDQVVAASLPWLVTEQAGSVIGYAYAGKWHGRCGYRYSVESTVYLDPDHIGRGAGKALYSELLTRLRAQSIHTVIGAIALPNPASVALHERLGFSKVGHFTEVGFKFGRWIDVGYWQTSL
jgi:phosphinothricin acetyltransferase